MNLGSIFILSGFLILMVSLIGYQVSQLLARRKTPQGYTYTPPPGPLLPDVPIQSRADIPAAVTQEHYDGRHAEYAVIGCAVCEGRATPEFWAQTMQGRSPYRGEIQNLTPAQVQALTMPRHPDAEQVQGLHDELTAHRNADHITTRVSRDGDVEIRVPFRR